jgi:hypothetical protein
MVNGELPVAFEIVNTLAGVLVVLTGWLPNATLVGLTVRTGETPVPVSEMLGCRLPGAVVAKVRVPIRAPVPVGLKITLILHDVMILPRQVLV